MSAHLVIARDCNMGDAIMALPTICALAKQVEPDPLYLAMTNRQVLEIADLPNNVINVLDAEPHWRSQDMRVQMIGVGAACNYLPHTATLHPIHFLMAFAGLDVDVTDLPQPRILVPEIEVPAYDVVLTPWTDAKERTMTVEPVEELCDALDLETVLVGGPGDPRIFAEHPDKHDSYGFPTAYGADFAYVVNLMRKAKCVVTIDSGPGRLAHAAGVGDRHIVLDSGATPWRSQGHPGAIRVKGGMKMGQAFWNTDDIVTAIKGVLER